MLDAPASAASAPTTIDKSVNVTGQVVDALNKSNDPTVKDAVKSASQAVTDAAASVKDAAGNAVTTVEQSKTFDDFKNLAYKTLVDSIQSAKDGIAWVKGQIPDILTEYLHWKLAVDVVYVVGGLIWFVTLMVISRKVYKWLANSEKSFFANDGAPFVIVGALAALLFSIPFFGVMFHHLMEMLQIIFAPKVYLLQQAAEMYKEYKAVNPK